MAQSTPSTNKPRTLAEQTAYQEGVRDGQIGQHTGIGVFSVFLACATAVWMLGDARVCVAELASRLDRIENAIGGAGE